MIFGKYINRYYLKNAPALLLGLLSLLIVDIAQLMIPELYRLVINGVNLGKVVDVYKRQRADCIPISSLFILTSKIMSRRFRQRQVKSFLP